MDIDAAIEAVESLIEGERLRVGEVLTPVAECLRQCAALHVSASVLVDNASDGQNRPDYRVDVADEHVDNLRELLAGQKIPEDPRYTALLLQVKSTIRQLQSLAERVK